MRHRLIDIVLLAVALGTLALSVAAPWSAP
jgi:hypothetical protein